MSRRVLSYLPDDALLIEASLAEISQISRLKGTLWVGRYLPEYKISPSLGHLAELKHSGVFAPVEPCSLLVSVFPGSDINGVISAIHSLGGEVDSYLRGSFREHLKLSAEGRLIPAIARIEEVEWIERFRPFVFAGVSGTEPLVAEPDVQVQIINAPAVWERGLTGAGQVLAICDTGLDVGVEGTPMHDDFEGRIEAAYALGRPDLWNDPDGHGTHVAGTAVGNGMVSDGRFKSPAHEARLVFQSGYVSDEDPLGGVPVNLYELYEQVYSETPARIHSDSWGSPDRSAYSLFSVQTDEFVWDHKDFLLIFAAGNDGVDVDGDGVIDFGSLYSPATAKNCIAVGASENVRSAGGLSQYSWDLLSFPYGYWSAYPIGEDLVSDNENGMAAFSSRGPCLDGRIKPDLVAPGTDIISCRTQDPQGKQATELMSWGVYDEYYVYMGGTSMAAPAVAGCAAVVRQFYTDVEGVSDPSAALLKATLINGAADMAPGQYGTGPEQEMPAAPNPIEGWGRVDLKQAIYPDDPADLLFVDETEGLETGQSQTYRYIVGTPDVALRATLAYSDFPASPAAAVSLVNDLDMVITTPAGQLVYPNGAEEPDRLNNVESVSLPSPRAGIYQITVSGENIPQGPQPYALVVTCGGATGRAAVSLDKSVYGESDLAVKVVLIDADLDPSSSPQVSLSSDSDPAGFTIDLLPSEGSPHVFESPVDLIRSGGGGEGLLVAHGDNISVTYTDADYGGTGVGNVSDSATVDLVPPVISDVSVSGVSSDSATIGWTSSETATGTVRYGFSGLLDQQGKFWRPAESHSITLTSLSENQTYWFSIQAQDSGGNQTLDDNGGQFYTFNTGYTVVRFRDEMELGEGAWTHSGELDQWEHGSPTWEEGPASAHSGECCWGTRLDGYLEHDDFFNAELWTESLVSPEIQVDSASKLTFWQWRDLLAELGFYDYGYVEISVDGGGWQNVTPTPETTFTGSSPGWVEEEIDLSPYAGSRIRLRFRLLLEAWFDYLGSDYQYAGWYIDDLVVSSTKPHGEASLSLSGLYCTTAVPLGVTLVDADLNRDPQVAETVEVQAVSATDGGPEVILLGETGPSTGVFEGVVPLDSGPPTAGDGRVQVQEGDTVTVSYEDGEGGTLSPGGLIQATSVVDLTPPSIEGLTVTAPSTDWATVSFVTDATAISEITYWAPDGQERSQVSSLQTALREFILEGLQENSLYRFRITVTDEAGNSATYSSPAGDFSFGTKAEVFAVWNAFDGETSEWNFSADSVWELGEPGVGPPAAHSPPYCWATDLDSYYPITCDASLESDWVTLPATPQLHFWHWYSIDELGWEGAYGTVEVSVDGETWLTASDESWYAGATDDWIPETVDLSPRAGQTVKVRFRLWSQEAEIVIYYYAGWYIDDVMICDLVSYGQGTLLFDRPDYSLNVPVVLTLIDDHLNADPQVRETCLLSLSSSVDSVTVELVETDVSSGRFMGQVYLTEEPAPLDDRYLRVAPGDSITAEYHDDDDGAGLPIDVTTTAHLDTTPPLISQVNITQVTDTSALVTWTTDTEAIGEASYAESASGPYEPIATQHSFSSQHSARIAGLSESLAYYLRLMATDPAGNVAVDDNSGQGYPIETRVRWEFLRDDFDGGDRGWTHQGLGDFWQWGKPQYGVMGAYSPSDCWATNLGGTYPGITDASLISPPLQLKEGTQLSFWHWFSINEYFLDEGEGVLQIRPEQGDWQPLPEGTFSGATKAWKQQRFDLSAYGEQVIELRFRLQAEQWIEFFYAGWYVDDVTLSCLRPFGFGVVQLDEEVYSIPGPVTLTLKDGHLPEEAEVEVLLYSTSDPTGTTVRLQQTADNPAVFSGGVELRLPEDPGEGLRVQYGDTVTAYYVDADDGLGGTNVERSAHASVWSPPALPLDLDVSYEELTEPACISLTWPREEGRAYRVYYCDDLAGEPPVWRRASGVPERIEPSSLAFTEPISPLTRNRFYRIEVW